MTEREQLRQSITTLEAQRPVLGDAVVEPALAALREKLAALEAQDQPAQQRKLATVLFADVSGFTALSETMDAEVVAEIMNDLWAVVDTAITGHSGRIDKHIGDAVMALWGAEAAREDDPERAVRGALAMQTAIEEFCAISLGAHGRGEGAHRGAPLQLAMRIGVNTGPVLLGQVGTTGEFTAMGDAVNLASRLEHAAPAGGVLISHDTYRHVRGVFDVAVREPIFVKGKAEPVQTYLVQRAKPRAFRMATRGVEGIETRMVGREAEMIILQTAYEDAIGESETRVVTISGETGVGKSRLLYEFDNWIELRPEAVTYFKGRGTPNTQNVPYSLFRDLFAFRFDILDSDSVATAFEKFKSGMTGYVEPDQAAIAGHWLGFDFSGSEAVSRLLGGSGFAETARAYLTRYFRGLLAVGPAVVLLEDIHWADDSSLDLVLHLTSSIPAAPLLVVAVARPVFFERRPGWGEGEASFQPITLRPLSKRASRALVEEILQRVDNIPADLRDMIVDSAEGNPYFVEELVKMLIEQGVIQRVTSDELRVTSEEARDSSSRRTTGVVTQHSSLDSWRVRADKLVDIKVPPTLTGLLQARLDGLPRPEREALQRASVVGRLFWDDAVAQLLETEREAVEPMLEAVRRRELIFRREHSTFADCGEYLFKHNLLRDVAYETVLLKHRAMFHGRVARWLEIHAGERHDEYLGLIAEHYVQAGESLKAAELLEQSVQEAVQAGILSAARQTLERALALRQAAGEDTILTAYQAHINLGIALQRLGEVQPSEVELEQGLAGARQAADEESQVKALTWLSRVPMIRGEFEPVMRMVEEALRIGRRIGGTSLAQALYSNSNVSWLIGDLKAAEAYALEMLEVSRKNGKVYDEMDALAAITNAVGDPPYHELARNSIEQHLLLARQINHLPNEARALLNRGNIAYFAGELADARSDTMAAIDRFQELGELLPLSIGLFNLAQAELKLGNPLNARQSSVEALRLALKLGYMPGVVFAVVFYAQYLVAGNDINQALGYYGLALSQPALENQVKQEIDYDLSQLDLPLDELKAGLAAGAALDFDTVVQEILDGRW
jgi:class 3 adenylate cyclase/tetratricopeptide (TPR) repeat protein